MEKKTKKELKGMGTGIKPTVHIGKEGVSEGLVEEIKIQIKSSGLVKVKVQSSSSDRKKEMAEELEQKTGAKLIETRGNTILLSDARLLQKKNGSC